MAQHQVRRCPPSDASARRRGTAALIALAAVAAMTAGVWQLRSSPGTPAPPSLEVLGDVDPDVGALLRELRAAIEAAPRDADRWMRFAMACEANGLVGASRDAYGIATDLTPLDARAWYRLALSRARLGETDAAMNALERTLRLAPEYAPAWSRRGLWLLDRGDADAAERAFDRARTLAPDDPAAWTGLARIRLARRQDGEAAELLERLLERSPGDKYALQLLGTAYRRLGRLDDAAFALAVGAAGEPVWTDPWSAEVGQYRRGFAALLKSATHDALSGRFDRALPQLEELRRRRPGDVALANHLGDALAAAGRHGEAIQVLAELIAGGAANAETHLALASAYVGARDAARAEAHVDRAIALGASGPRASEIKGLIAWRTGRMAQALRILEAGYDRDPRNLRLLRWTGFIRLERREARSAREIFGRALQRNPMDAESLAGLALAQAALGANDDAALALARAEQVAPNHPRVREARRKLAETR